MFNGQINTEPSEELAAYLSPFPLAGLLVRVLPILCVLIPRHLLNLEDGRSKFF